MAVAALNSNVARPNILIDTREDCLESLKAVQQARSEVYTVLQRELGNQNPDQLDQIRAVFKTILAQLNGLKKDSDYTFRCMNIHVSNQQTPSLDPYRKEEERLNALESKLREEAVRKGWHPISQKEDLRLDTQENSLASLQIIQAERRTLLKALESTLLGLQRDPTPHERSEIIAVLTQAKQLAVLSLDCANHYSSRWAATEQFKKYSQEQEKLLAWEKTISQITVNRGFGTISPQIATPVHLPVVRQSDLEIDTSEKCLDSLKLVQKARSGLLERLEFLVHQLNPDRFEIEKLLQDAEQFRQLSRFCLERYRWTPEAGTHNTVNHQTRCNEEARLDVLESTVLETAIEKGWIGRTVSMTTIDLPSTEKIIRFCKAHPLIPLGLAGSIAGFAGWVPMENPLGSLAPALAGFLTSIAIDPKQTVLDTVGLSDFVLKNIGRRALPIATWAIGTACIYDPENLSRAPYLLSTAALLQIGAHYELWKTSLSVQNLAASGIDGVKWWFRNGHTTGAIAGVATAAVSYSFDQSFPTIGLFGLGVYGIHAGFAFLHANSRGTP